MNPIEHLTHLFTKFPGVGPRQAGRFVYYLLRSSSALRREIVEAIRALADSAKQCPLCSRYHSEKQQECVICKNTNRDASLLMIVASDADLATLERSGTYRGHYFVLGGTIILGAESNPHLRMKEIGVSIQKRVKNGLKEIILAFPANPEGDATAAHVRDHILDKVGTRMYRGPASVNTEAGPMYKDIKITSLGRGLSTGSELEYADPDTLRNALDNRK